jgi:hypothetical protein
MDIYLAGAPIDRLFGEVTCGDVGLQGVKVIIPLDRYDLVLARLSSFDSSRWNDAKKLYEFLASRCDCEFLERYLSKYPDFIGRLKVGSYLYACSEIDVIVRLHELGLLPESNRIAVSAKIRELAVETPDAGFLKECIRMLLTPDEFTAILEDVRLQLLPNLDNTIQNWTENYDSNGNDDPEDYFNDLVSALKEFRDELNQHQDAVDEIKSALNEIEVVIDDLRSDQPQEPDWDDFRAEGSGKRNDYSPRSIFDDVDQ